MQIFNPNFSSYLLILLVIAFTLFSTGAIISRFFYLSKSIHFRVFLNLLFGYLFWITLTAFYYTKGNTVFLLIPISIVLYAIIFKRRFIKHNKYTVKMFLGDSKELLRQSWFILIIFILFVVKHKFANGLIESDYLSYANVSYTIKNSGFEGTNIGMFATPTVNPYHYSDIWFISLITAIFKTNYYHTAVFISIPILLFTVYSGTIALIKEIGMRFLKKSNLKYIYLFACLIIIIGGPDYPILMKYINGTTSLIQMPKLSIIYSIYICTLIFLIRNKYKPAFLIIMLLTALYTQTIFFVWPAMGILILISLFKNYKIGLKYLWYYLTTVLFIFGFYYFNSKSSNQLSPLSYPPSKLFEGLKTFPINFVKKSIRFSILYVPFIILFTLNFKKKNYRHLLASLRKSELFLIMVTFLIIGYFFSLASYSTISIVEQDYEQVLTNGLFPLLAIYCLIILIFTAYNYSVIKIKRYQFITVSMLLIITIGILLQEYKDPRYWGHIQKIDIDKPFYAKLYHTLRDNDRIATFQIFEPPTKEITWFQYNYQLYPLLRRIANFNQNGVYFPECLNAYEIDTLKSQGHKLYYKKSYFIHFMDSLKIGNNAINTAQAQSLFLKKYKFNYIVFSKNHKIIPLEINSLITDSISRNDGLRIYKLQIPN